MLKVWKYFAAGIVGLMALGASAAFADRPAFCHHDHDHRSHAANYYDYHPADRYYRAGPYRSSGLSISVRLGDDRYDRRGRYDRYDRRDRYDRYDRYDRGRRHGYRGREGRIVNREIYDTRYRARIVLTEEVVRGRHGPRLVCTVRALGPQARFVPDRHLHRIARRECSRRAQIRVYA